ncbi:hypothetical protein EDD18DRAFT_1376347 [Armillaria luteobubalina]|uniref:Uncharacterized protein n=1 Tax=Armillaria luteobubalina TaxID=153913 RepID=A0AA39TRX1_9AGAR|nr:hypothetical protein EDD18DRAFT_1376347 [Armillaria luteobubalina]
MHTYCTAPLLQYELSEGKAVAHKSLSRVAQDLEEKGAHSNDNNFPLSTDQGPETRCFEYNVGRSISQQSDVDRSKVWFLFAAHPTHGPLEERTQKKRDYERGFGLEVAWVSLNRTGEMKREKMAPRSPRIGPMETKGLTTIPELEHQCKNRAEVEGGVTRVKVVAGAWALLNPNLVDYSQCPSQDSSKSKTHSHSSRFGRGGKGVLKITGLKDDICFMGQCIRAPSMKSRLCKESHRASLVRYSVRVQ